MAGRVLRYGAGEKIIEAGKVERRMYIILDGSVEISLSDGKNAIRVATLKKGDFFGEISLFNSSPRSANAAAITDVAVAYLDNLQDLKTFLMKNPSFSAKMVHILAQRLAKTDEILIGKISELGRAQLIGK
ncbi:MAG TPA: cyclic nucleotide-binding domain-containing protein [Spirochaetota bacterium]|jgi:CRP-like cAMP-binding protein|nr:cyclic nucleotide-binding domain-containing protein [Spirochaetota bacterium]OPZ37130.1 MAG: cAMP receptor protein [Spirochaetes bacterium ADurb.BinA120]HNU92387.1 cyclic nucleotide-binding domain-containing protein [Spirochaetota bacterium]HPI14933.1 cyclic nucleotide-binding domain-containing protein [Spirochaetota bacterium]HPO46616.1 cyclic nucleotide-binding domain-containing protein [Spirochaetota bacterium]